MRAAIFVDAGYLYATGSKAIAGQVRSRQEVQLHVQETIAKLKETANQRTENAELLRIYWYDGASSGGLSPEHRAIADSDDVKLRLGVITPFGKQKGVDSLIVTDLIDLARNHAIAHAVLLSGDEDTRIGVQIAQSFGVRVHLVGVVPCRGNQSQLLRQEADTTTELSKADVETFLTLSPEVKSGDDNDRRDPEPNATDIPGPPSLQDCIAEFVAARSTDELDDIAKLEPNAPIPQELDGALLWICRSRLNRWLDEPESTTSGTRSGSEPGRRKRSHNSVDSSRSFGAKVFAELFDAQPKTLSSGCAAVGVEQALGIPRRTEQVAGFHPAGEVFRRDQRYRLRAAAANQDRFAGVGNPIHERGQVSTRISVGGFAEHLWTSRYR